MKKTIIGLILASPFLYVLSSGPVVALHEAGYLPDAIILFYLPLAWFQMEYPWFRDCLNNYIELFK